MRSDREPITLNGAEGWTSPNPHPALSLMRWTTTDAEVAAEALDQVVDRFRAEGVCPSRSPCPYRRRSDSSSLLTNSLLTPIIDCSSYP